MSETLLSRSFSVKDMILRLSKWKESQEAGNGGIGHTSRWSVLLSTPTANYFYIADCSLEAWSAEPQVPMGHLPDRVGGNGQCMPTYANG